MQVAGTITNNGTLTLSSPLYGGYPYPYLQSYLTLTADTLFTGSGQTVLAGANSNFITGNHTLTIGSGYTVSGSGSIAPSKVVNQGTVLANNGTLSISVSDTGGAGFNNSAGQIRVGNGSHLSVGGGTIQGGTIQGAGTGVLTGSSSGTYKDLTLQGGFNITGGTFNGVTLEDTNTIYNGTMQVAGTITNNGTLRLNSPNYQGYPYPFLQSYLTLTADTLFTGSGQTVLEGSSNVINGSHTLTIGSGHTVSGSGSIAPTALANNGSLLASGGILTLSSNVQSTGVLGATATGNLRQTGGTVTADEINVAAGGAYTLAGGQLEATDITGNLAQTGGTFKAGIGTGASVLDGNYSLTGGTLAFDIAGLGAGQFDSLRVTGNANLSGATLALLPQGSFAINAGDVLNLLDIQGTRTGNFAGFTEGAAITVGGNTLFATYGAGNGNDLALVSLYTPGSVNWLVAGSNDDAYFTGTHTGSPGSPTVYNYDSFDVLDGGSFELGVNDVMNVNTFYNREGAVTTANGIINGNVINSGLMRIPLVSLNQVTGGAIQVAIQPVMTPAAPVVIQENTLVSFGNFRESNAPPGQAADYGFGGWSGGECGGCGGGGSGGGGGGGILSQIMTIAQDVEQQKGTARVDGTLEVTGYYQQTESGMLRLFVGGDDPADLGPSRSGGNYSQLFVGEDVNLDGALQIVLQPELFDDFSYTPMLGDTFDFVVADGGITLESTLEYVVFVTATGANLLTGLTLSSYDSGIAGDPDILFRISETLFSFSLEDGGTILRGTLIAPLQAPVPIPSAVWFFASALGVMGVIRRNVRGVV
jgi:hypothetical protein